MSDPRSGAPDREPPAGGRPAIVTLTTDFGRRSSYVGSLRGAILSVSPRIVLADISHDVPPFDVREAALLLKQAAPAFPEGTVHLAVVDPGVGGERRAIAVRSGAYFFVGPDNGIFSWFLDATSRVWALDPARVTRQTLSRTFHGRDLFGPAAARLALGVDPDSLGDPALQAVRLEGLEPAWKAGRIAGIVLHADSFGNLITNIPETLLAGRKPREVLVAGTAVATFVMTYDEATPGATVSLVGSSGLLEVAVSRGSAAERLKAAAGMPVVVTLSDEELRK